MTTQFDADEQRQKPASAQPVGKGHQPPAGRQWSGLQLVCGALLRLLRLAVWTIAEQLAKLILVDPRRTGPAACSPVRQLAR